MADKVLDFVYFGMYDKNKALEGQGKTERIGYFHCRRNVAQFLDIEQFSITGFFTRTRKSHRRSRDIQSAQLTPGTAAATIAVPESEVPTASLSQKGSRTVILISGNKIETTTNKLKAASAFHTMSFRFPSWASIADIADNLSTLIPQTKFSSTPGANQIRPYFRVKGGRKYSLMGKEPAKTRDEAQLILTGPEVEAYAQKLTGLKGYQPIIIGVS